MHKSTPKLADDVENRFFEIVTASEKSIRFLDRMESLTVDSSPEPQQTEGMTVIIQKLRSEIVSVRDTVVGCYECINDCAVDHVTVQRIDTALALLNSLSEKC